MIAKGKNKSLNKIKEIEKGIQVIVYKQGTISAKT